MLRWSWLRVLLSAALPVVALAGCATDKRDSGTFAQLPDHKGRVVFSAPEFAGSAMTRIGFADILEREEYALFRTAHGQAETLFTEARTDMHTQTVIDFSYLVEQAVGMFRFNAGQPIEWSPAKFVKTSFGGTWARPYRLTRTGHACVGFVADWDRRPDDPERRPSKGIFGYACRAVGKPMPDAEAAAIVAGMDMRGITVPLEIKTAYELAEGDAKPLPRQRQVELLVTAQDGTPGAASGLPAFPLLLARGFTMQDNSAFDK